MTSRLLVLLTNITPTMTTSSQLTITQRRWRRTNSAMPVMQNPLRHEDTPLADSWQPMPGRRQSPWSDGLVNYDLFKLVNNASGNSFIDGLMKDAAKYAIALSALVLVVLCVQRLLHREVWPVIWAGLGLVFTFALGLVAAAAYDEKRPFQTHHVHQLLVHDPGQSFPSDHATAAFGIAFAVLVFLSRRWGVVLILVALLIGFSRVYDGVHYPGDIGGSLLCAAVGVAAAWGLSRILPPPARMRTAEPVGAR